jgi:hypothetical protein
VEFLFADWLGTPAWFWLAFLGLVVALTAFDLGILHKEDKEMGIGESLKLSASISASPCCSAPGSGSRRAPIWA